MATILKTKDLMIEVARQLFARFGFTNTTMNDIADASKKGRRTLYTYFKNKDEIYHAVIERELHGLWHDLELVKRLPISAEEKLMTMMLTHLDKIKDLVLRNGSLRAEFFKDIWLVEQVRMALLCREYPPHRLPPTEYRQGDGGTLHQRSLPLAGYGGGDTAGRPSLPTTWAHAA